MAEEVTRTSPTTRTQLIQADIDGEKPPIDEFRFVVTVLAVAGNETTCNPSPRAHGWLITPDQWELHMRAVSEVADEIVQAAKLGSPAYRAAGLRVVRRTD